MKDTGTGTSDCLKKESTAQSSSPEVSISPKSGRVLPAGLTALIIFAPLAFGSVESWSSAVLTTGAGVLLVLCAVRGILGTADSLSPGVPPRLFVPGLIVLALAFLQALPLGEGLVSLLSPRSAEIYRTAGVESGMSITLHREATLLATSRLGTAFGAFFLTLAAVRTRRDIRRLTVLLLLAGTFMALIGIVQQVLGADRIYWLRDVQPDAVPFGPFVNGNHFAAIAAMLIPLGLGYLVTLAQRPPFGRRHQELKEILAVLFVFALSTALVMTRSRGGILALLAGLSAMGLALALPGGTRRFARYPLAGAAMAALGALWFGRETFAQRLAGLLADARLQTWEVTLEMAADFPLFGSGLGTYGLLVESYRDTWGQPLTYAHNDPLQLLAEGGALMTAAFFAVAVAYAGWALSLLSRRHDREAIFLGVGGLGGLAAFLAHSTVDFVFHIPACAFWFSVVAALALRTLSEGFHGKTG